MTSQIARFVIASFRRKASVADESTRLSLREEQILQLLSQGYSNKMIADKLRLSVDTVCTHFKHVFAKLHVNSRTEAAVRYLALRNGAADPAGTRIEQSPVLGMEGSPFPGIEPPARSS
jgi:DNA-binding NarL/FixJ family response regulator